jgi:hypothetical protein
MSSYSTLIGFNVGNGSYNMGSNNIIIGKNITLPSGSTNSINFGNILYGTGTYSNYGSPSNLTPSITPNNGKIGVNVVSPQASFHVVNNTNSYTFIAESNNNNPNIFVIDNYGAVGVGTYTPSDSYNMHIKGSGVYFEISGSTDGGVYIGNSGYGGTTDESGLYVANDAPISIYNRGTDIMYYGGGNVQYNFKTQSLNINTETRTLGFAAGYKYISSAYTGVTTDHTINCTGGSYDVTLPFVVVSGKQYVIKNSGSDTITVNTTNGQTIDDISTTSLSAKQCATFVSTGSNWIITNHY